MVLTVSLAAVAAAVGLQCAQMKMLKPRPLQLVQISPLGSWLVLVIGMVCVEVKGGVEVLVLIGTYLGAFPAQPLHVMTVLPPMHDICSGSRLSSALVMLAIVWGGIER